ncbi:MAG: nucleoside recognition domain-containing protein [Eubacteriales bacterium]
MITLIVLLVTPSGSGLLPAVALTGFVVLGVAVTFLVSWGLSSTILKGEMSSFALELPFYRCPNLGHVVVRSVLDRTIFVLGRAVAVAAPAGAVIWLFTQVHAGDVTLLQYLAQSLDGFGLIIGVNGTFILALMLGFPANELVIPLTLMIVGTGFGLGNEVATGTVVEILMATGWTWKTALCAMVLMLFHWPCSTTCLTIYQETKSARWTALAFFLPTSFGVVLSLVCNGLLKLLP